MTEEDYLTILGLPAFDVSVITISPIISKLIGKFGCVLTIVQELLQ